MTLSATNWLWKINIDESPHGATKGYNQSAIDTISNSLRQ
jgi:hypothetical protein